MRHMRGSAQGCAFSGLENKNLTFKLIPLIPEKPVFWGPLLTRLRKSFFGRKQLYSGG